MRAALTKGSRESNQVSAVPPRNAGSGVYLSRWNKIVFTLRYLPSEMPSRKKDSEVVSLWRSVPYVITGTLVLVLAPIASPTVRHLPKIWLGSLTGLKDWYQRILDALLTLVWFWFAAYAMGVLVIEKLRRYYRQHIVRPIEKTFCIEP
jgi:hypothetical protein